MGVRSRIKVRRRWVAALLLWAAGAAAGAAVGGDFPVAAPRISTQLCAPGRQFWDPARERCQPCTVCAEPKGVVLRRCHVLSDTRCGHMRELHMGRTRPRHHSPAALAPPAPLPATPAPAPVEHRAHHRLRGRWDAGETDAGAGAGGGAAERKTSAHARRLNKHWSKSNSNRTGGNHPKKFRDYVFLHHHHHHHHHEQKSPPESAAQLRVPDAPVLGAAAAAGSAATGAGLAGAEAPSGGGGAAAEEHHWDWQAGVLVAAVAACALFFGAAALHGFRQLRSDARRSADADNLSATLSLIVPELGNEVPCNCTVEGYNGNQCLYIEKLLVRKSEESKEGKGNVYIDRGNSKPHK